MHCAVAPLPAWTAAAVRVAVGDGRATELVVERTLTLLYVDAVVNQSPFMARWAVPTLSYPLHTRTWRWFSSWSFTLADPTPW